MDDAVDAVIADKFGPDGIYRDEALFERIYNGRVRRPLPRRGQQLRRRRDRLRPRHLHLHLRDPRPLPRAHRGDPRPGAWLQAHHVEDAYYEEYFRGGLTDAHRAHDETWHQQES